jgi:anti-sigma factor RsiW
MRRRRRVGAASGAVTEDLLSAYVDDELDDTQRAAVEERLASSPEWQAVLDDVRAARDALRGLEPRGAPVGFWEQLIATGPRAPGAGDRSADRGGGGARHPRSVPRWAYVAAATAVAFVLAVAVVPRRHEVRPDVATFANAHAVRASLGGDPIAALAGAAVPLRTRR